MIENIRLSIKGILSHKMRSVLTMLGIIIGISSIIAIVAIINGASEQLKNGLVGGGDNLVTIALYSQEDSYSPYDTHWNGKIEGLSTISQDSIDMTKNIENVVDATPFYFSEYSFDVSRNSVNSTMSVYGINSDYLTIAGLELVKGRLFSQSDFDKRHNVAIVDSRGSASLFGNEDPIGKTITINDEIFVVVGVADTPKDLDSINSLSDYYTVIGYSMAGIYIPSTVWQGVAGYDDIQSILIKSSNSDSLAAIGTQAAEILNANVMVSGYEYKSTSLTDDMAELEQITGVISILLVGIASIALVVGGIGVMNIMLVSVTERTKEIGLKKAIGAKKGKILAQFLTEAVVLTSLGGVLGVLIGALLAYGIGMVVELPVYISATSVAVSVAFSMGVGIIFGLVPSVKASKLDPIVALRYE